MKNNIQYYVSLFPTPFTDKPVNLMLCPKA